MPLPTDLNRHLTGEFAHDQCSSLCQHPASCCIYFCFPSCAIYDQRSQILRITGEPYVCCGGAWPFCGCDQPRASKCLVCESFCCGGMALAANRFLVQTRFNKKNTTMDKLFSVFHICISLDCVVGRVCCECSKERENLCKSVQCACATSHCQIAAELEAMKKAGYVYTGPKSGIRDELPVHFLAASAPPQTRMGEHARLLSNH